MTKKQKIISALRRVCKKDGVELIVLQGKTAKADGDTCGGYFDGSNKKIVVGTPGEDDLYFFSVLFHEFGHFLQWRDYQRGRRTAKARMWEAHVNSPSMLEATTYAERYMGYIALLTLERDAERTMTSLLKKHNIGTREDRLMMTKTAALYLYCHRLMLEKKRWFKKYEPLNHWLENKELAACLPNTLMRSSFTRIPNKVRKLISPLF